MPFPIAKRILFNNNPLEDVICQVRFPDILKIETQVPADFQDKIRGEFPIYSERRETKLVGVKLPPRLQSLIDDGSTKYHDFKSEDEKVTVTLAVGFLALTSSRYKRWEQYRNDFLGPFEALIDTYSPAHFSRAGLRYINIIKRSALGFDPRTPWSELIQKHMAGVLASPEISAEVREVFTTTVVELPDKMGYVRLRHGLAHADDNSENVFVIDSDYFVEGKLGQDDVIQHLDYFNATARDLFHWAIGDRLADAMGPEAL